MVEVDIKDPKSYMKELTNLVGNMSLSGALNSKNAPSHYNAFTRFMLSVGVFSYYLFKKDKRDIQNNFFLADPKKVELN